jgi:hypothetical protein
MMRAMMALALVVGGCSGGAGADNAGAGNAGADNAGAGNAGADTCERIVLDLDTGDCGEIVGIIPIETPDGCVATVIGRDCYVPEGAYLNWALGATLSQWDLTALGEDGSGYVSVVATAHQDGTGLICAARYRAQCAGSP